MRATPFIGVPLVRGLRLELGLLPPLTVLAVLAVALVPNHARACDEVVVDYRLLDATVLPADGDELVPVNARIWVGGAHLFARDESFRVSEQPRAFRVSAGGVDVEGSVTHIVSRGGVIGVFTPDEPLAAQTSYDVFAEGVDGDEADAGDDVLLSTFTTTQDDDLDAPIVPAATFAPQRSVYAATSCAGQPAGATATVGPTFLTFIDVVDNGLFDDENLSGNISAYTRGDPVFVFAPASDGAFDVRLAAVDIAGNFSGWSEPQTIDVPESGCTCASSSLPPALATLGALGALALRAPTRRARRLR